MSKLTLEKWQERLERNANAYNAELARMDEREAIYLGSNRVKPVVEDDTTTETPHVRNIVAEIIEAEVDSNIPMPKVTAKHRKDENKAKLIEDMLRNELDRMPFEQVNDMMERTVPIQGGAGYWIEWDNLQRTHYSIGDLTIKALHPKQIIPQDGVFTSVEDADYIILKVPSTKQSIKQRFDIDVDELSELEPGIRGSEGASAAEDMVTMYVAYYRNDNGGIGKYSWVEDVELEDMEDYQARRLKRCATCGAIQPPMGSAISSTPLGDEKVGRAGEEQTVCPVCGGLKWIDSTEEYQEIYEDIILSDGTVIPGLHPEMRIGSERDELGVARAEVVMEPTRIPLYKPDLYPLVIQKTVSVYGRFLGDSDVDKIADQQNTVNRVEAKIMEKLVAAGSYVTLPADLSIAVDPQVGKVMYPNSPADMSMIQTIDLEGNVQQDIAYLEHVYNEARQLIGITDSFQGRHDSTATSGVAKQFAAAQSAGRLESKRQQKNAAYAHLFEAMFKFKLAYADEPRPIVSKDIHGNPEYEEFNRYDFLERDAAGEWYWNDDFLFSTDTSSSLASNREAMWQETRLNLQTGAFGNPAEIDTLLLFWEKMEMLHYPGAGETRSWLEEKKQEQQMAMQMMQEQQAGAPMSAPSPDTNSDITADPMQGQPAI